MPWFSSTKTFVGEFLFFPQFWWQYELCFFLKFNLIVVTNSSEAQTLFSNPQLPENIPVFIIMWDFVVLLELSCVSALSYGVSLDLLFLWPFWKLDVPLIFELFSFPSKYPLYHLPGNSLSNPQKADGMAQTQNLHIWLIPVYLKCCCQDKHSPAAPSTQRKKCVWAP